MAAQDYFQGCLFGPIKALGKYSTALRVNVVTYYVLSAPLCYVLAFPWGYELEGLWLGFIVGLTHQIVGYFVIIMKADLDFEGDYKVSDD